MTQHVTMTDNSGKELLPPVKAARKLKVSYCTLNSWRAKGCPYKMSRIGLRNVALYNIEEVKAWIENRRPQPHNITA